MYRNGGKVVFERSKMQPNPMRDYILEDINGKRYTGRWLVGNTYEGWYITEIDGYNLKKAGYSPRIEKQKDLKIRYFYENDGIYARHVYIPKKILDANFQGKQEIPRFIEPDTLFYI